MNWKLCAKFILITSVLLTSATAWAQGQSNITCLNQFYHNWNAGVSDVVVQGDYAYLACQEDGLRIVDIADLDSPYDVAHLPIAQANVLAIAGNYVYVGGWMGEVQVIDISNPASPLEKLIIPIEDGINSIRIYGDYAFICSPYSGLTIVDISNPLDAQIVWTPTNPYGVEDIEVHGTIACVFTGYQDMFIMDMSDITSPQIIDTFGLGNGDYVKGGSISDGYAYLACGWSGLCVLNLSTMEVVSSIDSLSYAFDVKIQNSYAYVHYGDPDCPIAIVDIADPSLPQTLGIYYPPQDLLKFTLKGDIMYVADDQHGLRTVDISDPHNPHEVAHYSRYGRDLDVVISGDYAYVQEDMKLKIIDITDLQHPSELGYFEMNWEYGDMEIAGNIAYLVTHGYTGLYAVDITDPTSPSLLGTFTTTDTDIHYRIAIYDHYAYLVENDGIRILNITDPADIVEVGYYDSRIGNAQIEIYENYAIVATNWHLDELYVLDLTDPISPTQVGSYTISGSCSDLKAADGVLYAAIRHDLLLFELPPSPEWMPTGAIDVYDEFDGRPNAIDIYSHYAYVTVQTYGLCVYDVADISSPVLTGYHETYHAHGIAAKGPIAIVADYDNLGFYDCSQALPIDEISVSTIPQSAALLQNYPNPFNASTQIPLELPSQAHVTLKVFDILGRHVTTLVDGELAAGRHLLHWNGTAANGQVLASGKYFVRAEIGDKIESMPILYLK